MSSETSGKKNYLRFQGRLEPVLLAAVSVVIVYVVVLTDSLMSAVLISFAVYSTLAAALYILTYNLGKMETIQFRRRIWLLTAVAAMPIIVQFVMPY